MDTLLPPPLAPPLASPPPLATEDAFHEDVGAGHWPGQRGSVHSAAAMSEIERMEERRREEVEAAARLRMLQRQNVADRYASAGELLPGAAASALGAAVPPSPNHALPPPLPAALSASARSPQQSIGAATALGVPLSASLDANSAKLYFSPAPAARETVVCEGFLRKQGKSRDSQWRRRWCILHPARLDYHKPSKRPPHPPQNRIMMESVLEVTVNTERHPEQFGFQLVTAEGIYAFQAIDATDQRRWVASMQSVVMTARRADGPQSTAGAEPPRSRLEADARAMLVEEDEMTGGSVTTTIDATLAGSRFLHIALRHICGAGSNLLVNVGRENEELVTVHSVDAADLGAGSQDSSGIVTLEQQLMFAHEGGERIELLAATLGHEVVDHVSASSAAALRSPQPEQATFQLSGAGHGGGSPSRPPAAFPQPRLAGADATQRVLGTTTMLTPGAVCLTPAKLPGMDGTMGGGAATAARSSLAMSSASNASEARGTGGRRGGERKKRAHRANITERAIGSKVVAVGSRTTSNVKGLVSARKVRQYIRWIDSLRVWRKINSLGDEFRNGLLLCRLMEKLAPEHVIKGRNRKVSCLLFIYRYISRETCSQFDSLPLTYLSRSP
jgi:hypothetical protein